MKSIPGLLPLCIAVALALPVQASSPTGPKNIPQRGEIPVQQHALAFFLQRFQADLASTEHVYDINAGQQREAAAARLSQPGLFRSEQGPECGVADQALLIGQGDAGGCCCRRWIHHQWRTRWRGERCRPSGR